jgi:hypothetical protein
MVSVSIGWVVLSVADGLWGVGGWVSGWGFVVVFDLLEDVDCGDVGELVDCGGAIAILTGGAIAVLDG